MPKLTETRVALVALLLLVVVASAMLAATAGKPPRRAEADVTPPLIGIQTWPCLALTRGLVAGACFNMEQPWDLQRLGARVAGLTPTEMVARGSLDGGVTAELRASDFAGIDLDKNQQHELDALGFWMMAFVTSDAPVTFSTTRGIFSVLAIPTSALVVCGPGQVLEEEDCDNDGVRGDGVVVAKLVPFGAARGTGVVTARQGSVEQHLDFTIVGEPMELELQPFETVVETTHAPLVSGTLATAVTARTATIVLDRDILTGRTLPADIIIERSTNRRETVTVIAKAGSTYELQTGKLNSQQVDGDQIDPLTGLPYAVGAVRDNGTIYSHPAGGAVETASTCQLPATPAGLAEILAAPDKTILIARTKDSDGTTIANALVKFSSSDIGVVTVAVPLVGTVGSPIVPTLDLGAFGVGAPMVICGGTQPGTATVTIEIGRNTGLGLVADPNAVPTTTTLVYEAVAAVPTLTPTPSATPSSTPTLPPPATLTPTPTDTPTATLTAVPTPTATTVVPPFVVAPPAPTRTATSVPAIVTAVAPTATRASAVLPAAIRAPDTGDGAAGRRASHASLAALIAAIGATTLSLAAVARSLAAKH